MPDIYIIRLSDGLLMRRLYCSDDEININVHDGEFFKPAIDGDYTHYSESEGFYKVESRLSDNELLFDIRRVRSQKLNDVDLMYCNAERWASMPDEQKAAWAEYKQALRDFPDTCDPTNPVWPIPPQ